MDKLQNIFNFYEKKSPLHNFNPTLKLILASAFIANIFMNKEICLLVFNLLLGCMLFLQTSIPLKILFKKLLSYSRIFIASFIINLSIARGNEALQIGFIKIHYDSLYYAFEILIRLLSIFILLIIIFSTTTMLDLSFGLQSVFKPLRLFGIPVDELTVMFMISIRFMDLFIELVNNVQDAYKARCFKPGYKSMKALKKMLVFLIASTIKYAEDIANAMESRNYAAGGRSNISTTFGMGKKEYIGIVIMVLNIILTCIVIIKT